MPSVVQSVISTEMLVIMNFSILSGNTYTLKAEQPNSLRASVACLGLIQWQCMKDYLRAVALVQNPPGSPGTTAWNLALSEVPLWEVNFCKAVTGCFGLGLSVGEASLPGLPRESAGPFSGIKAEPARRNQCAIHGGSGWASTGGQHGENSCYHWEHWASSVPPT